MPAEVTFFSVGQGDCTLIVFYGSDPQQGEAAVLVDCGSKSEIDHKYNGSDPKKDVRMHDHITDEIAARLGRLKNPNTLDYLIITHPDEDHYNYLGYLLFHEDRKRLLYSVRNVLHTGKTTDFTAASRESFPAMRTVLEKHAEYETVAGGPAFLSPPRQIVRQVVAPEKLVEMPVASGSAGEAGLYLIAACTGRPDPAQGAKKRKTGTRASGELWPPFANRGRREVAAKRKAAPSYVYDPNREAIALLLLGQSAAGKEQRVFLMADTGEDVERLLISRKTGPGMRKTWMTWLKAGHHGSRTSTSDAWLDFIQPDGILISSGTYAFGGDGGIPPLSKMNEMLKTWKALPRKPVTVRPNKQDRALPEIGYFADRDEDLERGAFKKNFRTEPGIVGVFTNLVHFVEKPTKSDASYGYDWQLKIDPEGANTYTLTYE
ncbi:beta-lactamase [Streptomyces sp. NBRC 110611]|nr:beta-lactamase [Streptomyces sp. NBRC 110611]